MVLTVLCWYNKCLVVNIKIVIQDFKIQETANVK